MTGTFNAILVKFCDFKKAKWAKKKKKKRQKRKKGEEFYFHKVNFIEF